MPGPTLAPWSGVASAGIEQRRGRTILPTDVCVLIFLALAVAGESGASTDNQIAVVVFTLLWMSAAVTRLTEFRRGERPAVQVTRLDRRALVMLLLGSGPWIILKSLKSAFASAALFEPIDVPSSLQALGVALALAVIAEPFLRAFRKPASDARAPRVAGSAEPGYPFSASVMIRSGAILLLSGSPSFAVSCALWLGVTCWPRAGSASENGLLATEHSKAPPSAHLATVG